MNSHIDTTTGSKVVQDRLLLAINPGSTSTKLSIFNNQNEILETSIEHSSDDLKPFKTIAAQTELRLSLIRKFLLNNHVDVSELSAVAGRGGLLKPVESGVYSVNQGMLDDLVSAQYGEHASNLGAILAHRIAQECGCSAYIIDPVVVDEMEEVAKFSGMPEITRKSIFHALNQKSAAREVAALLGKPYNECSFIVAHLGGGISVGAHKNGRVVDVNNALNGDGPFSPERTGGLPCISLIELCFSGRFTLDEMKKKIAGKGGLVAYRGSNSCIDLENAVKSGDKNAELLYKAMIYQISKEIAMHGATLKGKVDCVVLTGGMAKDKTLTDKITDRIGYLAPVKVIPGEREMTSLAAGVLRVLDGLETAKEYHT